MRRDVAAAYVAIGARIGGLFLVSAAVYRALGVEAFAVLSLVRSTIGLLNYTGLGLGPALVHLLAAAGRPLPALALRPDDGAARITPEELPPSPDAVLGYASAARVVPQDPRSRVYSNGEIIAFCCGLLGLAATAGYVGGFGWIHNVPGYVMRESSGLVVGLGLAVVFRLFSDVPGSVLQVSGHIARDNLLVAAAEVAAAVAATVAVAAGERLGAVGFAYAAAAACLLVLRSRAADRFDPHIGKGFAPDRKIQRSLLAFGGLVTLAQLADFLYSPTDYILISRLLTLADVSTYAPAVQIDAGLLTLVTGLSAVLLPVSAVAHGEGDVRTLRSYYVRGTLASTALLAAAAGATWLLSPWIFKLWLGDTMPATRAILPLVLVHTVVGGSGAAGRSILLGMGKVKPFTASVLVAGVANVVLSYVFVRYLGWGLRGIVLGTIIAVVARAAVWMPWYVLRTLRVEDDEGTR